MNDSTCTCVRARSASTLSIQFTYTRVFTISYRNYKNVVRVFPTTDVSLKENRLEHQYVRTREAREKDADFTLVKFNLKAFVTFVNTMLSLDHSCDDSQENDVQFKLHPWSKGASAATILNEQFETLFHFHNLNIIFRHFPDPLRICFDPH